jgi:hypothetical protein
MAHVEFKISRQGWGFGCGEDCEPDDWCYVADSVSGGGNTGGTSFLVAFFGHQVWVSGLKTLGLGLTFTGCTWQWRISNCHLVQGNCSEFIRTFFKVKTHDPMIRRRRCVCTVPFLEASFLKSFL